jgi:hypothetical protein
VNRTRAADDFATIRARMEEFRRERERGKPSENETVQQELGGRIPAAASLQMMPKRPSTPRTSISSTNMSRNIPD